MFIGYLPEEKQEKVLAAFVTLTLFPTPLARLVCDVIDKDCWAPNGSTQGPVFATFETVKRDRQRNK